MNKYTVRIPYSYSRYGTLTATVYAEDEDECSDLLYECENRYSEDYDDGDNDGDTTYEYSDAEIELDEEDVVSPNEINSVSKIDYDLALPCRFIEDLVLI
ncbi:MAG: hypothetical protein WC644_01165 [Ignavibacteria bacterium]